jgi:glycine oxidase
MPADSDSSPESSSVAVIGAGIAGSWQALLFARAGYAVTLMDRDDDTMTQATSHWAGGMLAPWCEQEISEPIITHLGKRSLALWRDQFPDTSFNGTIVVAHQRDRPDLERFARMTAEHVRLDADSMTALEPQLDRRFSDGLFFPDEAHVEPRSVLPSLHASLLDAGGAIRFQTECDPDVLNRHFDHVIDCRGLGARDRFPDLRGVKGEMIVIETPDVALSRPIRLLHPRWPIYIIPRDGQQFMIGATSIESEDYGVSVRSVLELLTAAYSVDPAFAEARVIEIGSGLRPAFPDNLPRIVIDKNVISVNGLYRHGFLLSPMLAQLTLAYVQRGEIHNEIMRHI